MVLNIKIRTLQKFGSQERGVGLIEFAMIIPILLAIIVSGIDLSNILRAKSRVMEINRDIGNTTFRDCVLKASTDEDDAIVRPSIENCLNNSLSTYMAGLAPMIDTKRLRISISLARQSVNPGAPDFYHTSPVTYTGYSETLFPRINSSSDLSQNERGALAEQKTLLFCEVKYDYSPLIAGGASFGVIPALSLYEISTY